jgi:cobalt-zinc-cadmium efflux system protein
MVPDHRLKTAVIPLGVRLFLGFVFLYASFDKILHPAAFAEIIYNYRILPECLIHWVAIILPWMELLLGCFLIFRVWLPGGSFLSTLLLLGFLGSVAFNMARGLDIRCGCFNSSEERIHGVPMLWYVVRDTAFFLLSLYLFLNTCLLKREGDESASRPSCKNAL